MQDERVRLDDKIRIAESPVVTRPVLRFRKDNGAENFAALHLRRLFFLLCRLRVKRALGLRVVRLRRYSGERAMIRDRDPGTDRNRNARVSNASCHIRSGVWSARTCPRFESGDMSPLSR